MYVYQLAQIVQEEKQKQIVRDYFFHLYRLIYRWLWDLYFLSFFPITL